MTNRYGTSIRSDRRASSTRRPQRRGLATLEMALSFPILFFMGALIFVMAKGMVLTSETSIEARKNSFEQALDKRSTGGMTRFVLTDGKFNSDIFAGSAAKSATVIPVLGSSTLKGNAQVSVLRNTWDYRELPLSETSRLPLYGGVLAGGSAGKLTSLISQLGDAVDSLGSVFDALGSLSQATQGSPGSEFTPFDALNAAKEAATNGLKDLQGQVDKLQGEIDDLKETLKDLKDGDLKDAKEKIEKLGDELDKQKGRLDFLNGLN
jgi:hypothetical protein